MATEPTMSGGVMDALKSILATASKPERFEPGPGDVGPSTETKGGELVSLKMTEEECGEWWKRIERAQQRRNLRAEKWDLLLKEYQPIVKGSNDPEDVKVMAHFRNVHSRIGQLFYRSPDLILTPREPGPAQDSMPNPMPPGPSGKPQPPLTMEDIIAVKQSILTEYLGPAGIKMNRLMDELLFDVLAWTGIGCSKLGYRCVFKDVQQPKMVPQPTPQVPGSILGLSQPTPMGPPQMVQAMGPDGQPVMETVSVPIYEEYYNRRFSPKKLLFNDDLRSTRYDEDATMMGMEFFMSPSKAAKVFKVSEDELNKAAVDTQIAQYEEDQGNTGGGIGLVHGFELWVKASAYTDEVHPQAMNQLVLIEGIKNRPLVWRPSPDQTFDERGKLTKDSLVGFPIRVLAIRDLADSPFPEADAAFTNTEIKQLSTYRRQGVMLRDAQIGKYLYDKDAFDEPEVNILKTAPVGSMVGVSNNKLAQGGDKVLTTTAQVHGTQDNYRGAADLKQDINETLAQSAVQAGTTEDKVHSATEIAAVGRGANARNNKELLRSVDFYVDCARMIDQLIMRYADTEAYATVTGQNGARRMMVWKNTMVTGKFLYEIAPDSQLQPDTASDFAQTLQYYNVTAQDALSNRVYVLRKLARMRGFDPGAAVIEPSTIPPKAPEPLVPSIGFSFKAEDLILPDVRAILLKAGLLVGPDEAEPTPGEPGTARPPVGGNVVPHRPQPGHGGANPQAKPVSAHLLSNSGGMENAPGAGNHRERQVK